MGEARQTFAVAFALIVALQYPNDTLMPFLIRVPAVMARRLCLLTLFYIAIPLVIFFIGWLRPLWGIPLTFLLGGTLGALAQRGWKLLPGEEAPSGDEWRAFTKTLLWTWVPIALVTLQVGVGGFGQNTYDWDNKHNLIFADLVKFSWPVVYRGEGTATNGLMLVYYLAYYLPGAAIGKVLGWNAANITWQLWTQLGMLLLCAWLIAFAGVKVRWLGLLFLIFSGAEFLGFLIHNFDSMLGLTHEPRLHDFEAIHRWRLTNSYYVLYGSNILQLFWAPQHLLAGWLGIALILNRWNTGQTQSAAWDGGWGGSALLGWAMLVFWSPLSALGCLPFLLTLVIREFRSSARAKLPNSDWKLTAPLALLSAACVFIIALYLAVKTPPAVGAPPQRGQHLEFLMTSLWRNEGFQGLWRYISFVLVEFGLMYALLWPRRADRDFASWRAPLAVGLGILLVLPCFLYGYYNDLAWRASIPSLAILFFTVTVFLQSTQVSWARRIGVLVLLMCGTVVILTYSRSIARTIAHHDWYSRRPESAFHTIVDEYRNDPRHFLSQYTGPTDSPFARFFAK